MKDFTVKVFNGRDNRFAHVGISLGEDDDNGTADGAGWNNTKDVTSDIFLEEEFGAPI